MEVDVHQLTETVEGISQSLFDAAEGDDVIDSEHYLFCVVTDDSGILHCKSLQKETKMEQLVRQELQFWN